VEAAPGLPADRYPKVARAIGRELRTRLQIRADVTILDPETLPRTTYKTRCCTYARWSEPMSFRDACIPVRLGWSSPFARWQGPLAEVSSLDLAAQVTTDALARSGLPAAEITGIVLGWTVPQPEIFYGASTVAARIGAPHATGAMLSQACATSAACLEAAALRVEAGLDELSVVITTDRTSNGPVLTYPAPSAPGGAPRQEIWVLDSFRRDPWGGLSMVATAERVAAGAGLTRERLDEVALLRYEQYQAALAGDRAFQRRYMIPVTLPGRRGEPVVVDGDVGVHPTTAEGLAKLAPAEPGGVVTYGTQTHPADGTAGLVVTTASRARELAGGEGIARILGTGVARVGRGEMPTARCPPRWPRWTRPGLTRATWTRSPPTTRSPSTTWGSASRPASPWS